MADWFEWNGERCTDYGIRVGTQPDIIVPAERVSSTTIPGMSGNLTMTEGKDIYDNISFSISCFIENTERIDDIIKWLRGSGKSIIANRPDGYYNARITNQIPLSKILKNLQFRAFSVTFDCKPFLMITDGADKIHATNESYIVNSYILDAIPTINIEYTSSSVDKFELRVGDLGIELNKISGIKNFTIDCNRGIVYYTDENGNNHNACQYASTIKYTDSDSGTTYTTDDDWIYLPSESRAIVKYAGYNKSGTKISSLGEKIYITPNWRTL